MSGTADRGRQDTPQDGVIPTGAAVRSVVIQVAVSGDPAWLLRLTTKFTVVRDGRIAWHRSESSEALQQVPYHEEK